MACHGYSFFSSRRRHTRFDCDWSSDVCSSDLRVARPARRGEAGTRAPVDRASVAGDRKSVVEGKSVDLGGRRMIKKKKQVRYTPHCTLPRLQLVRRMRETRRMAASLNAS